MEPKEIQIGAIQKSPFINRKRKKNNYENRIYIQKICGDIAKNDFIYIVQTNFTYSFFEDG